MGISKVILNGVTKVDLTQDTVTPDVLITDYTAHNRMGQAIVGTAAADNTFFVTLSKQNDVWTPDCTFAEAQSAYNAGKTLVWETQTSDSDPSSSVSGWSYDELDGFYYTVAEGFSQLVPDTRKYEAGTHYYTYQWFSGNVNIQTSTSEYDIAWADASVSDVRNGKWFYNADGIQTGTMANGSATTPATTITANPSISVNSSGLITATASASKNITPTVSEGYVNTGTAGTITVSGSNTSQLTTQAAKTVTPTESEQTAVAAGRYTTGAVKVGAISSTYVGSGITQRDSDDLTASGATVSVPAGYYAEASSKSVATGTAGTPTATKGTVSNHSVTINPSVTNTAGYITGGTKTGTAVTVSASELVSGTYAISSAGTKDVTNYASASVASGSVNAPTATKGTVSNHSIAVTPSVTYTSGIISGGTKDGTAVTVTAAELESGTKTITENGTGISVSGYSTVDVNVESAPSITVSPLTVTQNGTYTAPSGTAYTPVIVDVSGGGGATAEEKDVNFIDYDGTILYSYTPAEFAQLSALPANPGHAGLTAQGWNWSLSDAKTYVAKYGKLNIGQMYITTSGATEIDITLTAPDLSPTLMLRPNGTVTIDWGDNSATDTVTGTSLTVLKTILHTYASAGHYTIKLTTDGGFAFYGPDLNTRGVLADGDNIRSSRYSDDIDSIRLGSGVAIGRYAFLYCINLKSISIPNTITSVSTDHYNNAFYYCYSLKSITLPTSVTTIGANILRGCYSLSLVSLPKGIVFTGTYNIAHCYTLRSVVLPDTVTNLGNYALYDCYSLSSVVLPDSITSIGTYTFQNCYALANLIIPEGVTSIPTSFCSSCFTLASLTIPNGVTSIGTSAFSGCYGLTEIHFLPTTPPTLVNTNAFTNVPTTCIFYVPAASLEAYQTATNWSTYASQMVGE